MKMAIKFCEKTIKETACDKRNQFKTSFEPNFYPIQ